MAVADGSKRSRARFTAAVHIARNSERSKAGREPESTLFKVMDMPAVLVGEADFGRKAIRNISIAFGARAVIVPRSILIT